MKNLLLILLFLLIQPVSNEQIQQNMGFQQPQIVQYQQQPQYFATGSAKAPWRYETYTVTAIDGTVFTVRYRTIVGSIAVYDVDGGGLDLDYWYLTKSDLINAINQALQEYNMSVPSGSPICLLLFGISYIAYLKYKNVWSKCRPDCIGAYK